MKENYSIWDILVDSMKQYYSWYYPAGDEFDPLRVSIIDYDQYYSDGEESLLHVWLEYHPHEDHNGDDVVYHVLVNRQNDQNEVKIAQYSQSHKTSFYLPDSQE